MQGVTGISMNGEKIQYLLDSLIQQIEGKEDVAHR